MTIQCGILILALLITAPEARTARSVGTFTLGTHTPPAALDPYSASLSPERRNPDARIHATLLVESSFNLQSILDAGGEILRQDGGTLLISCRSAEVERIAALPGVNNCAVSLKPQPLMDSVRVQCRINEVHGTVPNSLSTPYTGKGVITGILDSEFDTRHPAFLDSTGTTRFLAIWNQHDSIGAKKNRFGYGTIKFKSDLIKDTAFGLANSSHGTHTSSTMAGSDRASGYYGAAPDGILVAVQYTGILEIADGLRWICSVADSLKLPCVINMSIGIARGPHDGTSLIDQVIDSVSGPGRIIVGAVGNDGGGYSHVRFTLPAGATKSSWVETAVDSTPMRPVYYSGADFWGEAGKTFTGKFLILDTRTMTYVQSGNGFTTSRDRGYGPDTIAFRDSTTGRADTFFIEAGVERANDANRRPHLIVYTYTTHPNLLLGLAITNPGNAVHDIHGWNTNKRYFTGAGVEGFEYGDSLFTVNEIGGTAKRNITVGGYTARIRVPVWDGSTFNHECTLGGILITSGTGPTIDGRVKPDITAPAWSVIAALSRNASREQPLVVRWPDTTVTTLRYGAETGTSMAAPAVAGIVALMLQADPTLTPEKTKALLTETAMHDEQTGPLAAASNKWGAGKVNAYGAMAKLLGVEATLARDRDIPPAPVFRCSRGTIVFSPAAVTPLTSIELIDMHGRTVFYRTSPAAPRFDLPRSLAAGVYTIRIVKIDGSTYPPAPLAVVR